METIPFPRIERKAGRGFVSAPCAHISTFIQHTVALKVAGAVRRGKYLIGWLEREATGIKDGIVYRQHPDGVYREEGRFFSVGLKPLEELHNDWAVFKEGTFNREDFTHVLYTDHAGDFLLTEQQAAELGSRLYGETKFMADCERYRQQAAAQQGTPA